MKLISTIMFAVVAAMPATGCAASGALATLDDGSVSTAVAPASSPAVMKTAAVNDMGARLYTVSKRFLGVTYFLGPLGEGPTGEFDRSPLVNFKNLDCTTFVEETMAFTLAPDDASVMDTLRRIRYKDGVIAYQSRNHFTELDWLPNNIAAGFLKDITAQVAGKDTGTVSKVISKRAWYAAKTAAELKGFDSDTPEQHQARLERMRALGVDMPDQEASLKYVPLAKLIKLLPSIPSGTVVSLVREARADKPTFISHQFFIFDGPSGKIIRHAAYGKQVMDVPAAEYIAKLANSTWPVLGFNLSAVVK